MYDSVASEITQATPPPYHRWWDCAALVAGIVFTFFDGDGGSWTDAGERVREDARDLKGSVDLVGSGVEEASGLIQAFQIASTGA